MLVSKAGGPPFTLFAERRFYPVSENVTTEAAIAARGLTNIYVSLGGPDGADTWVLRVYYHPMVLLIWFGPALMSPWRVDLAVRPTHPRRCSWNAGAQSAGSGMRRLALILACIAATLTPALAVEPSEMLDDPRLEERARDLSKILRCVKCRNQSIDDSNAAIARDMRIALRERLAAGDTDDQAIAFLVDRYGNYILLQPPVNRWTWALWGGARRTAAPHRGGFRDALAAKTRACRYHRSHRRRPRDPGRCPARGRRRMTLWIALSLLLAASTFPAFAAVPERFIRHPRRPPRHCRLQAATR